MAVEHIVILLAAGVCAGFAAGLLGLGGAFITTPVQYVVYTSMGLATDVAVKLAFGTSLLVVLPTAVSGAWRHSRREAVWWRAAVIMGIFSLIGSFIGATLATHLAGASLKVAFGGVYLVIAIRLLTARLAEVKRVPRDNLWLWIAWAFPIGIVTGILGIGGGVMLVPVMVVSLRFNMHLAVATSLAMMIFTSTGGVTGYIVYGLNVPSLPAYSFGYVNLPAWFLLTVGSVGMAQVGAVTAHKLPAKQLRYVFIAIMFYMGLRMVGVFDWLGWPL